MTHPTDALRLVPVSLISDTMTAMARAYERIHSMPRVSDTELAKKVDEAKERLRPYLAAPASPPAEQSFVRTPNEDDRLRRALYRLLERHGAGPDALSVVGSLWDTLDQDECTDLIEDWLITGKTIQVEGDVDKMLASIPEEAPASPLPEGGGPTCQVCGGKIEAWTCQGCGAQFHENDAGSLVLGIPAAPTGAK